MFNEVEQKQWKTKVTYPKCRQSVERIKASLVGFIACNGLNGPSEFHLIMPSKQINQVLIYIYTIKIWIIRYDSFKNLN